MLNLIKDAAYTVKALEKNLPTLEKIPGILKDVYIRVDDVNKKLDEIDFRIGERAKQLEKLDDQLLMLKEDYADGAQQLYEVMKKEKEIGVKMKEIEKHRLEEERLNNKERINHIVEEYAAALSAGDFIYLIVPSVIDFLIDHIQNEAKFYTWIDQYTSYYSAAEKDYGNNITDFFTSLSGRGIKVKGKERYCLSLLRNRVLQLNYERIYKEYEFHFMDQAQNLEEAVYYFLNVKDNSAISASEEELLAFLYYYLLEHGYGNHEYDLFFQGKLLGEIKEKYYEIEQGLKRTEKEALEAELSVLREDDRLTKLIDRFIKRYDCIALTLPTAIDILTNQLLPSQRKDNTAQFRGLANELYQNSLGNFLLILDTNGYKKPYRAILERMKELILKKNYEDLKRSFEPLFRRSYSNIAEVIYDYFEAVGKQRTHVFTHLVFLSVFLFEKGLTDEPGDILSLINLIEGELERHDVLRREKELMKEEHTEGIAEIITMDDIEGMSGTDFIKVLSHILNNLGFMSTITEESDTKDVDIFAEKQGKKYLIQAVRNKGNVGKRSIQNMLAGMQKYDANVAWVISSSGFTPAARKLAEETNTVLWDGEKLRTMLELAQI